jgi:AcrR family transcriptional regulator
MIAVADAAGVAVPTVYKVFKTKAALVKEVYDGTLAGDHDPVSLGERPDARRIMAEADARRAVAAYATLAATIGMRLIPLRGVLAAADQTADAQLRAFADTVEAERLAGATAFARRLQELGALRVDVERARDVLFLLIAPDVPHRLVTQRGWTPDQLRDFLDETISAQLLRRPARRHPARGADNSVEK